MQATLIGTAATAEQEEIVASMLRGVSATEMLMIEASRMLVEYLCGTRASDELLVTALLGEAETSLQSIEGATISDVVLPQLDRAKIEGAMVALREARTRVVRAQRTDVATIAIDEPKIEEHEQMPLPATAVELDRILVKLCRELAQRNLRIGQLVQTIFAC